MKTIYIPITVYHALEKNPYISVNEIKIIGKSHYSTAARYKNSYHLTKKDPNKYQVHHNTNRVQINHWKFKNNQQNDLNIFLEEILNKNGFNSTNDLIKLFYSRFSKYKGQSKRNFNRYFIKARNHLIEKNFKSAYMIIKSNDVKVGFLTIPSEERPSD